MGADLRLEPRMAAARRRVSEVHDQASEPPASEAALVGRAFFTTDPESRLYRKAAGREATLCYLGHVTMENWHGLAVAGTATKANGAAERHAAQAMPKAKRIAIGHRIMAGAGKAMMRRTISKTCVPSASRRMWCRTRARPKPASVAEAPQDDRMCLRLGQTAWHNA
jgi:hypothetical protein